MKNKLKLFLFLLLCCFLFIPSSTITASADSGPKPSLTVTLRNLPNATCYGTLLSEDVYFGPFGVGEGENSPYADVPDEVWTAFVKHKDPDGYYFLTRTWALNENDSMDWLYYPPYTFKVLLYFPEQNVFVESKIYTRYAFDSYYTVDCSGITLPEESNAAPILDSIRLQAKRSYDYTGEILSLLARVIITVALELYVAYLFKIREKKQLLFLTGANLTTQIILNVLLNIVNYRSGSFYFFFYYFLWEFIVFAIEAIAYAFLLNRFSEQKRNVGVYILYALLANVVSFLGGCIVATFIPYIF